MPIDDDSILRFLPRIEQRSLLILDSIRFSAELVKFSFDKLEETIIDTSLNSNQKNIPELFYFAWNAIDQSQRLLKIIQKLDSKSDHDSIKKIADSIRLSRNTYQHLDQRIDTILINDKNPFFGKLKWCFSYKDETFADFIAVSGTYLSPSHELRIGSFSAEATIQNIILETVDQNNTIEINLTELRSNIRLEIIKIENSLNDLIKSNNLNPIDRSSITDILLIFKGEKQVII